MSSEATLIARLDRLSHKYSCPCQLRVTETRGWAGRRRASEKSRQLKTREVPGRCIEGRFILFLDEPTKPCHTKRTESVSSRPAVPAPIRAAEREVCPHCGAITDTERKCVSKKVPRKTFTSLKCEEGTQKPRIVSKRTDAPKATAKCARKQIEIDGSSSDEIVVPKRKTTRNALKKITYVISSGSSDDEFTLVRPERKRKPAPPKKIMKIPSEKCVPDYSSDSEIIPIGTRPRFQPKKDDSDSSSDHLLLDAPINSPCLFGSRRSGDRRIEKASDYSDFEHPTLTEAAGRSKVQRYALSIGGVLSMDCVTRQKEDSSQSESVHRTRVSIRRPESSKGTSSSSRSALRHTDLLENPRTASKHSIREQELTRHSYGRYVELDASESSSSSGEPRPVVLEDMGSSSKVDRIALGLARRADPSTKSDAISSSFSSERKKRASDKRILSSSSKSRSKTSTSSKTGLSLSPGVTSDTPGRKPKSQLSYTDSSEEDDISLTKGTHIHESRSSSSSRVKQSSHSGSKRTDSSHSSSKSHESSLKANQSSSYRESTSKQKSDVVRIQEPANQTQEDRKALIAMTCSRELRSVLQSLQEEQQSQAALEQKLSGKDDDSDDDELLVSIDVKHSVTERPSTVVSTRTDTLSRPVGYHSSSTSSERSSKRSKQSLQISDDSDSSEIVETKVEKVHSSSSSKKQSSAGRMKSSSTSSSSHKVSQSHSIEVNTQEQVTQSFKTLNSSSDSEDSDTKQIVPLPEEEEEVLLSDDQAESNHVNESLSQKESYSAMKHSSQSHGEEETLATPQVSAIPPSEEEEEVHISNDNQEEEEYSEQRISLEDLDPRRLSQKSDSEDSDNPELQAVLKNLGISSGSLSNEMDSETVERTLAEAGEFQESDS